MITKIQLTFFYFFILKLTVFGQTDLRPTPKKLKAKGDFLHTYSETNFPIEFETFNRHSIYSFDYSNKNVAIVYKRKNDKIETTLSIYIYPAGDGYEGRLRREYFRSLQSIANMQDKDFYATQFAVKHVGEKYTCNGFKAVSKSNKPTINQLTLFECGTWFFKIRLTTNDFDSIQFADIENKILKKFDPSRLTALKPLSEYAKIFVNKNALRDSTLLLCAMASAFKKVAWAKDSIKQEERASGFPSLYLEMQTEALKEFVTFQKGKNRMIHDPWTVNYLKELNTIIDNGFLNEFVMEQFDMILILPENLTVDFEAYYNFIKNNKVTIDLNKEFYIISYGQE